MLVELLMNEITIIQSSGAQLPVSAFATLGALESYLDAPLQQPSVSSSSSSSSSSASAGQQQFGSVLHADNERLRGRIHSLFRNSASARGGKAAWAAHQTAMLRHFSQKLQTVNLLFILYFMSSRRIYSYAYFYLLYLYYLNMNQRI